MALSWGIRNLLLLLGARSPLHVAADGCPNSSTLATQGLSFELKTVNGYYLGYKDDPNSVWIEFHESKEEGKKKGYKYDWVFEACATGDHSNYNVKAGRKDGSNQYLKCGGAGASCSVKALNHGLRCQDKDWQSFQVQSLGSHCSLLHTSDRASDTHVCANPAPALCSGLALKAQMDFSPATCPVIRKPEGKWMSREFSGIPWVYTLGKGVTHAYQHDFTTSWGISATASFKMGFEVEGGPTNEYEVSTTVSLGFEWSWQTTLTMEKTETKAFSLPAGQLWQWQFTFEDPCGLSTAQDYDFVVTNSRAQPPCCLPGFFQNATVAHGACLASSDGRTYDLCASQSMVV